MISKYLSVKLLWNYKDRYDNAYFIVVPFQQPQALVSYFEESVESIIRVYDEVYGHMPFIAEEGNIGETIQGRVVEIDSKSILGDKVQRAPDMGWNIPSVWKGGMDYCEIMWLYGSTTRLSYASENPNLFDIYFKSSPLRRNRSGNPLCPERPMQVDRISLREERIIA